LQRRREEALLTFHLHRFETTALPHDNSFSRIPKRLLFPFASVIVQHLKIEEEGGKEEMRRERGKEGRKEERGRLVPGFEFNLEISLVL
jgi:hypothetical protein